jgi:predicted nucleic acid-binding protein
MIVVDSSVWIGQLRHADTRPVTTLNSRMDDVDSIIVGDLVLLEVLQGARDDKHAASIERSLRRFTIERMLDDVIASKAAGNYRILRQQGITIRTTIDLIIATFCIERGHSLLHDDRDFDAMTAPLGLTIA